MEVRDAVEEDAESIAELVDSPRDVLLNVIHDRTVRVAEDGEEIVAFVSFDARPGTVYVTQLGGETDAVERLLEEPTRFADREDMTVELLVPEDDDEIQNVVGNSGFDRTGRGPEFDGVPTIKYRRDPHPQS